MQTISISLNESITIQNQITITILEIDSDHVRLAINDPQNNPQYREINLHLATADQAVLDAITA